MKTLIIIALTLIITTIAPAKDKIYLTNGKILKGQITYIDNNYLEVAVGNKLLNLTAAQVQSLVIDTKNTFIIGLISPMPPVLKAPAMPKPTIKEVAGTSSSDSSSEHSDLWVSLLATPKTHPQIL